MSLVSGRIWVIRWRDRVAISNFTVSVVDSYLSSARICRKPFSCLFGSTLLTEATTCSVTTSFFYRPISAFTIFYYVIVGHIM